MFSTGRFIRVLLCASFWGIEALLLCECANDAVVQDLVQNLTRGYGFPYVRPVKNSSSPVAVGFRFTPIISTLNDIEQELKMRGMMALTWEDHRLSWKPQEYDGIQIINMPLKEGVKQLIWQPELVLNESFGSGYQSLHPETMTVSVQFNGTVLWYSLATIFSFCKVTVESYPFDIQTCGLTFTTWMFNKNEQYFYPIYDLITDEKYKKYEVKHGKWELSIKSVTKGEASYDCHTCAHTKQSFILYVLQLRRSHNFLHFVTILLPCLVMSLMTLLVMWLPRNSDSAAAGFGLTCVLTLFVFLTFLFSQLPSTGQPILGAYISWLIVEGVLITIAAVYDARILQKAKNSLKEEFSGVCANKVSERSRLFPKEKSSCLPRGTNLRKVVLFVKLSTTFIFAIIFLLLIGNKIGEGLN